SFKTDGELSAGAGVVGTREEGAIRLQHGSGSEVNSSLASRTVLGDILHEFGGATNCFPMDSCIIGNDAAAFDVWKSRKHRFEKVHGGGIVAVMQHRRSNIGQEFLLDGEFVKLLKKGQRLFRREAGDEFRQRLSRQ